MTGVIWLKPHQRFVYEEPNYNYADCLKASNNVKNEKCRERTILLRRVIMKIYETWVFNSYI